MEIVYKAANARVKMRAAALRRAVSLPLAPPSPGSSLPRKPSSSTLLGCVPAHGVSQSLRVSRLSQVGLLLGHLAPHPHSALPSGPPVAQAHSTHISPQGGEHTATWQVSEGAGTASRRRCLVCPTQRSSPGPCMQTLGTREAPGARWHIGGLIQKLLIRQVPAGAPLAAGGRWLGHLTAAGTRHLPPSWSVRQLHTAHARESNPHRKSSDRAGGSARVAVRESRSQELRPRTPDGNWAAQHGKVVGAMCQTLKTLQARGEPAEALLKEALQPWARLTDKYVVGNVLKELAGDPSAALAFFRWAQGQPWCRRKAHLPAYNLLLGILGRSHDFSQVSSLLEEMQRLGLQPNVVTHTQLLSVYGRAGKWGEVDAVRRRLEAQGEPMDIFICSTLVDIYSNAGFHGKAIEAYENFVATGGKPHTKLCNRVIWLHGQRGYPKDALGVLNEMKDRGCSPDLVTYNSLLDAFGKAGQVATALRVFGEMVQLGVEPNVVTFNALVHMCGKNGMCEDAVRLFHDMERRGITPDVAVFTSLVSMWGREREPHKAQEWYDRMLAAGCQPNVVSHDALLHAYLKGDMLSHARRVLLQLQGSHGGVSLDTYRMLLRSHMQCADEDRWDKIWGLMELSGHHMHDRLKLFFHRDSERAHGGPDSRDQQLRADSDALLDSVHAEDLDLQRGLVDTLVSFLWKAGRMEQAFALWASARRKGLWNPQRLAALASGSQTLTLNFHEMAWSTALVALTSELAALRQLALGQQAFLGGVELITGRGNRSAIKGMSQVKHAIEQMVAATGLPFLENSSNPGRLRARGVRLKQWLVRPEAEQMLSFRGAAALKGCEPPPFLAETE
eukprot:jgi/Mesen1/9519/ME000637S08967